MTAIKQLVVLSPFARDRHIAESPRSHFAGSEEELVGRVVGAMADDNVIAGYRDGVIKVIVDPEGFFTPVVELKSGDKGEWEFVPRQEGEEPRMEMYITSRGEKMPAKRVEIILYRHDVLVEGNEQSCDADWEIVSINASPWEGEEPIRPNVLMANHFQISGGTATGMSDHEFVEALKKSFLYWRGKMSIKPR